MTTATDTKANIAAQTAELDAKLAHKAAIAGKPISGAVVTVSFDGQTVTLGHNDVTKTIVREQVGQAVSQIRDAIRKARASGNNELADRAELALRDHKFTKQIAAHAFTTSAVKETVGLSASDLGFGEDSAISELLGDDRLETVKHTKVVLVPMSDVSAKLYNAGETKYPAIVDIAANGAEALDNVKLSTTAHVRTRGTKSGGLSKYAQVDNAEAFQVSGTRYVLSAVIRAVRVKNAPMWAVRAAVTV